VDESFLGPWVIRVRGALGEKVFEATWAEGQAMGMEAALAEARRQLEEEAAR
jgi:hypothetical protein